MMLNMGHQHDEQDEHRHGHNAHLLAHHQKFNRYREWQQQNEALTAEDAAKAQASEQRIFEQGRELKKREAEFRAKLDSCKQGDALCHRRVISDEIRQQRMRALASHHHGSSMEVTDAMGRSMPMLFNGHPEPFHSRAGALTLSSMMLFVALIGGLLN